MIEAHDGAEALSAQQSHEGPIDLLITDVVMPKLGGPELAEQMQRARPDLPVIYMSGYSDNKTVREMMADRSLSRLRRSPASLDGCSPRHNRPNGTSRPGHRSRP